MANKTQPTTTDFSTFLATTPARRQPEGRTINAMMQAISGCEPVMWGASLVGYGRYHYRYESGREGDAFRIGFSPRKAKLVLYVMPGFGEYGDLLSRLGKYKTGKSCLYINKLADVDIDVLRELVEASWAAMAEKYPS